MIYCQGRREEKRRLWFTVKVEEKRRLWFTVKIEEKIRLWFTVKVEKKRREDRYKEKGKETESEKTVKKTEDR